MADVSIPDHENWPQWTYEQALAAVTGEGADMHTVAAGPWLSAGSGGNFVYHAFDTDYISVTVNTEAVTTWQSANATNEAVAIDMANGRRGSMDRQTLEDATTAIQLFSTWAQGTGADLHAWASALDSDDSAFKGKAAYVIQFRLQQDGNGMQDIYEQVTTRHGQPIATAMGGAASELGNFGQTMATAWLSDNQNRMNLPVVLINEMLAGVRNHLYAYGLIKGQEEYTLGTYTDGEKAKKYVNDSLAAYPGGDLRAAATWSAMNARVVQALQDELRTTLDIPAQASIAALAEAYTLATTAMIPVTTPARDQMPTLDDADQNDADLDDDPDLDDDADLDTDLDDDADLGDDNADGGTDDLDLDGEGTDDADGSLDLDGNDATDAGADGGLDTGTSNLAADSLDTGTDTGTDIGSDTGTDAAADGGLDAALDTGTNNPDTDALSAGSDTGAEIGADGGLDTGTGDLGADSTDTGVDTALDTGTSNLAATDPDSSLLIPGLTTSTGTNSGSTDATGTVTPDSDGALTDDTALDGGLDDGVIGDSGTDSGDLASGDLPDALTSSTALPDADLTSDLDDPTGVSSAGPTATAGTTDAGLDTAGLDATPDEADAGNPFGTPLTGSGLTGSGLTGSGLTGSGLTGSNLATPDTATLFGPTGSSTGATGASGTSGSSTGSDSSGVPFFPPMMGANGGGTEKPKERERQTWLCEDEKVWGTHEAIGSGVVGHPDEDEFAPEEVFFPRRVSRYGRPTDPRRQPAEDVATGSGTTGEASADASASQ